MLVQLLGKENETNDFTLSYKQNKLVKYNERNN